MSRPEQDQVMVTELLSEERVRLEEAFAASFDAHEAADRAEEQLKGLSRVADSIVALQGVARATIDQTQRDVRITDQRTIWVVQSLLDRDHVDTAGILDVWYDHRIRMRRGSDSRELHEERLKDKKDREAFNRLVPGTKIINLVNLSDMRVADIVTTLPSLSVDGDEENEVYLLVTFQTEGTEEYDRRNSQLTVLPYRREPRITQELDGLAESILVGEKAINEFFDKYEPPILPEDTRIDSQSPDLDDASKTIEYIDALATHGLVDENAEAVAKMQAAVIRNCFKLLGIKKGGQLKGLTESAGEIEFLAAVRRFSPPVYGAICDTVGLALYNKTYRWIESYITLIAAVEHGKKYFELEMDEKASAYSLLMVRGEVLART